eukprot:TRINITY_DN10304_c0_g1_i1.p1 TRINITY_DN10304_c0_g1~~TRINITY_DN10304_c0_g1_i1.p1  ORF type:complete len:187 (+),score=33.53 TRINITY_DN10304_c0_g1_i1:42-602(+)
MTRRPPRSTLSSSSAASDVYKRQYQRRVRGSAVDRRPCSVLVRVMELSPVFKPGSGPLPKFTDSWHALLELVLGGPLFYFWPLVFGYDPTVTAAFHFMAVEHSLLVLFTDFGPKGQIGPLPKMTYFYHRCHDWAVVGALLLGPFVLEGFGEYWWSSVVFGLTFSGILCGFVDIDKYPRGKAPKTLA